MTHNQILPASPTHVETAQRQKRSRRSLSAQSKQQQTAYRRRMLIEKLEQRLPLALDLPFQNPYQPFDVNQDLVVSPLDALVIINRQDRTGNDATLPVSNNEGRFYDVNGSGTATLLDGLDIINYLNLRQPTIAARLDNDSSPAGETDARSFDLLTNTYDLRLGLTNSPDSPTIKARLDAEPTDPFIDVTSMLLEDPLRLPESAIDQVAGGPLADGDHRIELRIGDQGRIQEFVIKVDRTNPSGSFTVDPLVRRSFDAFDVRFSEPVVNELGDESLFDLRVTSGPDAGTSVPILQTQSTDASAARVLLQDTLQDQSFTLELAKPIVDAAGNTGSFTASSFTVADPTGIAELSPAAGESLVSVLRKSVIRFDEPVDTDSVTGGGTSVTMTSIPVSEIPDSGPAVYLVAAGRRLAGRLEMSSSETFATFFPSDPLPPSTEIRVVVDGSRVIGRDGIVMDADGDDEPGGKQHADFRTLPLTTVAGTNVFGFVRDSTTGNPIVGATIRVDSLPEKNVVTDANGRFELVDMPAPEFFVHIDGTTATNLPEGFVYPNVGKPFHSKAGRSVQLKMNGEVFDIFLPQLKETDIQELSATEPTIVGFGDDGRARLATILPDIDPTLFDEFALRIAAGSAVDNAGIAATTAAIIPVEPDRIPAPLPPFLDPQLVVSIQVPGATRFDVPAEITFPNLDGLSPGEKASIFSFDHDSGRWKIVGTGTVSPDGRRIVSDGGVIQAPGWHNVQSGSRTKGSFKDFNNKDEASVTISGVNRLFSETANEAQIVVANTSDKPISVKVSFDGMSKISKTGLDQTTLNLGPRKSKTIDLTARDISEAEIDALQDDDPDTNHAKIQTGSVRVEATAGGEKIGDETFLYGLIIANDGRLTFPDVLDEEDSEPAADDKKALHVAVEGPVRDISFTGDKEKITFAQEGGKLTFTVLATDLIDPQQQPAGELTLKKGDDALPVIPVNAADAIQLDPFAIRRVSGEITGNLSKQFSINGKVEVGLAGSTFEPFLEIEGRFEVTDEKFLLSGTVTTDLLKDIPGFGEDVLLVEGTVLEIDRATKAFDLLPKQPSSPETPPKEKSFKLAGLKFTLTELFLPASGIGLGLKGKVTLPKKLGSVVIDIGAGENTDNAVIITRAGVDLTGAIVNFPDQKFKIFNVDAEATNLSLEFQKRGLDDQGMQRGNRFLLRGELVLLFPKFDPDLRIAASFASPDSEEPLVDLSESLGKAWTFALEEEPELANIDAAADNAPEAEDPPEDSFIRMEFKGDGSLGFDAVGRMSLKSLKLGKLVTIEDAFLQIDTVNDNYLGFARVTTPFKRAGEITALMGIEGGNLDLIALGVGQLNSGIGFQMGTTPMYLQAIGGGLKDLTDGVRGIDLIASMTSTLGPATAQLFEGFTLPSFLGGASFNPGNLLQIDVGGNVSLEGFNLGGQVVVGGDEDGGLLVGTGKINANFVDPSVTIKAKLEALGGLVQLRGLGDDEFATLTVNGNFDIAGRARAIAKLPDELPFVLDFAEGAELASASAVFEFSNDSISSNNFLAYWGEVPLFTNPFTGNVVTAVAGIQIFLAAKFPNLITSLGEARSIAGSGESEFTQDRKFEIPTGAPYALFATDWETASATASIELVDPSGNTTVEADFANNDSIIIVSTSTNNRTIAVVDPLPGQWSVRIVDPENDLLGETNFSTLLDAPLPTITIDAVSIDATQENLTVSFDTTDATELATASIFLDRDQKDFDGALLATGVPVAADGTGSIVVDLSGLSLPAGEYFVFAQLDEPGKPLIRSAYTVTGFQVTDPDALPAVENVKTSWPGNSQLDVQWDDVEGASAYVVGLTDNAAGTSIQQTIVTNSSDPGITLSDALLKTPLIAGETYRVEVAALDDDGVPGLKGGRAIGIVGPMASVAPTAVQFNVFAPPGETYTGQLDLSEDEVPTLLIAPDGSSVDSDGLFTWSVPSDAEGFHDLRFQITSDIGTSRFEQFTLFAASAPNGRISGQIFADSNRDAAKDAGELGSSGVSAELLDAITGEVLLSVTSADADSDEDSEIDPEAEAGRFDFSGLAPGTYSLRRADVANQLQTLMLGSDQEAIVNLGNRSEGSVAGAVLHDIDFDGIGDVPIPMVTAFLDLDGNGELGEGDRRVESDDEGKFLFDQLLAGDFDLGIILPTGFEANEGSSREVTIAIDEALQDEDFTLSLSPNSGSASAAPEIRLLDSSDGSSVFAPLDFGEISVDGTEGESLKREFELLNLGDNNLVIESATIIDSESGFSVTGLSSGQTVLPDGFLDTSSTHPFSITFDPLVSGEIDTVLSLSTNAPNSPMMIRLRGIARATGPELTILLPNNNMGGVVVGETESRSSLFSLQNTGSETLSISDITGSLGLTPTGLPADFPSQPILLDAGEFLELGLDVTATQSGLHGGMLTITSDDEVNPVQMRSLVVTGITASDSGVSIGEDFVAIQTPTVPNAPVLRDVTKLNGDYEFFLTAEAPYDVTLFDPESGLVAKSLGTTVSTGRTTEVTQPQFVASVANDTDGDLLPDDAEFAIGTAIDNVDTDGDGVSDFAEVRQGLDPLSGLAVTIGVLSNLSLEGQAKEVELVGSTTDTSQQTAYIATGSGGLAIVDASDVFLPITLGQLDLDGDASDVALSADKTLAAVATGASGLAIVDVSDPMMPSLNQTVDVTANRVETFGNVAFVGGFDSLTTIDLNSGTVLQSLTTSEVTDVVRLRSFLYVMDVENRLSIFEFAGLEMFPRGELELPNGAGRMFVSDGLAIATAPSYDRGGIVTVDITDPDAPLLISDSDIITPSVGPSSAIAANGTGLAVVVGDPIETPILDVVDISDPLDTEITGSTFRTRIELPSAPMDVAIGSGIAFVANGESGLQIVNFLAFDDLGVPPTVSIDASESDVDVDNEGTQVFEGRSLPIKVDVQDDVQLRSVQLLVDGVVTHNDVSFPFDVAAILPQLPEGSESQAISVQVRAVDTGNNIALSDAVTLDVIPDTLAPEVTSLSLAEGDEVTRGFLVVDVEFSERIALIDTNNVFVTSPDSELLPPVSFLVAPDGTSARFTYQLLATGDYTFTVDAPNVVDLAGNSLGDSPQVTSFKIPVVPTATEPLFPGLALPLIRQASTFTSGDFNGDLIPDVAVTMRAADSVNVHTLEIYLGTGSGTFGAPMTRELTGIPGQIFAGDFSGDGVDDIAIRYVFQINISVQKELLAILVGTGDGMFLDDELSFGGTSFVTGSSPDHIVIADFDDDADLDVAAALSNGRHRTFLNRGDASFDSVDSEFVSFIPFESGVGDLNGDGFDDIVDIRGDFIRVLIGDGTGMFTTTTAPDLGPSFGRSVALADLNEDGNLDLIVGDRTDQTVEVLLGEGDGTFGDATSTSVGAKVSSLVILDLDGDGHLDIAAGAFTSLPEDFDMAVLIGDGSGGFSRVTPFFASAQNSLEFPLTADFDVDGNADIAFIGHEDTFVDRVEFLLGDGGGAFAQRLIVDVEERASGGVIEHVTVNDLNGDGIPDLIVSNPQDQITVLLGLADGSYSDPESFDILGDFSAPSSIVSGHFNPDEFVDVAVSTSEGIIVLLGDGSGALVDAALVFERSSGFGRSLTTGDINDDGQVDLIGIHSSSIVILPRIEEGTFADAVEVAVPFGAHGISIADMDNDGVPDIVLGSSLGAGTPAVLLQVGDLEFADAIELDQSGEAPQSIVTADFDGDGQLDIATANRDTDNISLRLRTSDGRFATAVLLSAGDQPGVIAVGELNGDENVDLVVSNRFNGDFSVYLGNGDGTFASELRFAVSNSPAGIAIADLNGDEFNDLVVMASLDKNAIVLLNLNS